MKKVFPCTVYSRGPLKNLQNIYDIYMTCAHCCALYTHCIVGDAVLCIPPILPAILYAHAPLINKKNKDLPSLLFFMNVVCVKMERT